MRTYAFSLLAMAATCCAQGSAAIEKALSTDLTLALYDGTSDTCNISNAPTIHFSGFPNATSICVPLNVWSGGENYTLENLPYRPGPKINYTVSNRDQVTDSRIFTGLWYEQRASPEAQNPDNLGQLLIRTFPCGGCRKDCRYDHGNLTGLKEWLQWDCIADGACYDTQAPIRSFWIEPTINENDHLDEDEALQNDKCQLAAGVSTNSTLNNNTKLNGDGDNDNGGAAFGVSKTGLWMGLAFVVGALTLL